MPLCPENTICDVWTPLVNTVQKIKRYCWSTLFVTILCPLAPVRIFRRRRYSPTGACLALSQSLDEDERNHHYLLSTQPRHRTARLAFARRFRWWPVVPCESRA